MIAVELSRCDIDRRRQNLERQRLTGKILRNKELLVEQLLDRNVLGTSMNITILTG
jgi:hypothetical protein